MRAFRHGETVKTAKEIRQEKLEKDKYFAEVAKDYFEIKGSALKGFITDYNRYKNKLAPILDKLTISHHSTTHGASE